MALPKIDQPLFAITIPSTGQKTKFRPFTVKEEKILLVAQESNDKEQIMSALFQTIQNCVQGVEVDDLSTFDFEYLLLKIRAKAADNIVKITIIDNDTEEQVELSVNIDEVEVTFNPDHNKVVKVTEDISLAMRYPSLEMVMSNADSQIGSFDVMTACIESVIQGDEVFVMDEFSKEEKDDFIDSLTSSGMSGIKTFFETMPKMRVELDYKDNTGKAKKYVVEGTEAFFM